MKNNPWRKIIKTKPEPNRAVEVRDNKTGIKFKCIIEDSHGVLCSELINETSEWRYADE
jgi:hypothetical protein